ncbi:unnamed protein product [Mytilus edulis]|uniref:Uncharacterized protein n=1 Tax=Mytilus edulis TaxID=6550 RepID=A0A8S3TGK4_MYTED|nr:unnamed protein product [Mytilus edulis]
MAEVNDASAAPTILMKKKKSVFLSEKEVLLLLKAYQTFPCSWDKIIEHMKENTNSLPEDAKKLYSEATVKQLRSRLSTKFGKLLTSSTEKISNDQIKRWRKNFKKKPKAPVKENDIRDRIVDTLSSDEELPGISHKRPATAAGPAPKQPTVVAEPDEAAGPALQQLDAIAGPAPQQPDAVARPALQQLDAVAGPAPRQPEDAGVEQIEDRADELAHPNVVQPKKKKPKKRPIRI